MNINEKTTLVQSLLGNDTEATSSLVQVYLAVAKNSVLNRLYPFGVPTAITDVPTQWEYAQCQLAQRYFLRRGAEGEIAHNENGVNRSYDSVNDEDILGAITPKAKVGGTYANA